MCSTMTEQTPDQQQPVLDSKPDLSVVYCLLLIYCLLLFIDLFFLFYFFIFYFFYLFIYLFFIFWILVDSTAGLKTLVVLL